ncbi:MAG TPA: tryptophan 2,3-dioxygenase family protein [Myxococcaceae bacterium]
MRTPDYSEAEKLRRQLESPIFNPLLKKWVGKGELDYEVYIKTPTLLNLQTPMADLVHHDELLFQITHQAQELWMKLVSMEAVEVVAEMDGDLFWPATGRMDRILRTMKCLVAEMNVLESMTPDTYQIIRRSLGNGSGQESPGYNAIRLSADAMEAALDRALTRRGIHLKEVYKAGAHPYEDLKRVCEQFVDMDELFQTWLYTHYQMVRRIIGVDRSIKALDGLPTQVLAGRMTLPLFRKLWEVRVEMTNAWKRDGGYAPGVARQGGPPSAVPNTTLPPSEYSAAHAYGSEPAHGLAAAAQAPSHSPAESLAAAAHAAPPPPVAPPTPSVAPVAPPAPAPAPAPVAAAATAAPSPFSVPQAPPEDPWSKPEPPTSRRDFHTSSMLPTGEDPWSRPEPSSRRIAEEATTVGGLPPKTGGSY